MGGSLPGRSALSPAAVPPVALGADQVGRLDRAAETLGLATETLMALAGFQCARLALRLVAEVDGEPGAGTVVVLAGRGNNGGDALVAARHLAQWGVVVRLVVIGDPARLGPAAGRQLEAAERLQLHPRVASTAAAARLAVAGAAAGAALAVDGLLGTGGRGDPREPVATAIRHLNQARLARVLSIDVPSGLDATSGLPGDPCVAATDTAMLGVAKRGCLAPAAGPVTGTCWLADIGLPTAAFTAVGLLAPVLGDGEWARVDRG
ncbi:MAG TPA: NAD(P)H-hydrate epimerase [Candidatus Micrarchaeia archaeon]|nr:NAD(P)H-hydrate epimerase [Candidatus Micrarchaeia archaeon]